MKKNAVKGESRAVHSIKKQRSYYVVQRDRGNSNLFNYFLFVRKVGHWHYVIATGYGGGGLYAEVFAKIMKQKRGITKGYYSNFLIWGDKSWQNEFEGNLDAESSKKILQREKSIFSSMTKEMFKKYFFYDDECRSDDIPYLRPAFRKRISGKKYCGTIALSLIYDLSKHWPIVYRKSAE